MSNNLPADHPNKDWDDWSDPPMTNKQKKPIDEILIENYKFFGRLAPIATDDLIPYQLKISKQALLETLLAEIPKSGSMVQPDIDEIPEALHWIFFRGQKRAIEEIESNLRKAFE